MGKAFTAKALRKNMMGHFHREGAKNAKDKYDGSFSARG